MGTKLRVTEKIANMKKTNKKVLIKNGPTQSISVRVPMTLMLSIDKIAELEGKKRGPYLEELLTDKVNESLEKDPTLVSQVLTQVGNQRLIYNLKKWLKNNSRQEDEIVQLFDFKKEKTGETK